MPARVTLDVVKGKEAGESYAYTEKESLILGRGDDLGGAGSGGIRLTDPTVSRYHCMVEILPPTANFRDFGSGNGIRLNGEMVVPGRFRTGKSIEEARAADEVTEFPLKDGDVIALSSECEIAVRVFVPETCAECFSELEEGEESRYQNDDGENICASCHALLEAMKEEDRKAAEEAERILREEEERAEQERLAAIRRREEAEEAERQAADEAARIAAEQEKIAEEERLAELKRQEDARKLEAVKQANAEAAEKEALVKLRRAAILAAKEEKTKCMICGKPLPPGGAADNARICPACRANPMKILQFMLQQAAGGAAEVADIKGFRRISELGRGGMGAVFKVEEEATGEFFALKMMLATKSGDADARAKFLREASIGKQLQHPHILRHYRYGGSGDAFFVVQEICEGGSVDKLVERSGGKLPVALATDITLQILDALIYAHKEQVEVDLADGTVKKFNGIVHRDIKPANYFLVNRTGALVVKLADFGMAKAFEAAGLTDFTRTGDAGGTPVFMPRQQIINYKYTKPDVDVWAVAASYYFMLTGRFAKDFDFKKDVWGQALKNPAVPIRKRDRGIDKRLAEVIDRALIEKPAIGYSTALELKKAIEGAF